MEQIERPNTVSGLNAKREELLRLRKTLHDQIRKITVDIDHLEACIRLFDPANTPEAIRAYTVQHRARKGTVKRFVMATLREAPGPLTSMQITDAWLEARGLRTDDDTRVVIRKRIGASLISLRAARTLANQGVFDGHKGWVVA
jgi:hypothetical protein